MFCGPTKNRGQGEICTGVAGYIERNCTQPKRPQNSEYFKDKMLLIQDQENGVALDEEQLLFSEVASHAIEKMWMSNCSGILASCG
ncbi:hypothetical protein Tco_0318242 [Tanacetum coccineum]